LQRLCLWFKQRVRWKGYNWDNPGWKINFG
jgi:hypothetical protein